MPTSQQDYTELSKEELIIKLTKTLEKQKILIAALKEIRENTASQMEWEVADNALKKL